MGLVKKSSKKPKYGVINDQKSNYMNFKSLPKQTNQNYWNAKGVLAICGFIVKGMGRGLMICSSL